jgi:hypothetical protein
MSASVAASGCPIREHLVASFSRLLEDYHRILVALLDMMSEPEARKEVQFGWDSCMEARNRLAEHEREHGCIPSSQRMSR